MGTLWICRFQVVVELKEESDDSDGDKEAAWPLELLGSKEYRLTDQSELPGTARRPIRLLELKQASDDARQPSAHGSRDNFVYATI